MKGANVMFLDCSSIYTYPEHRTIRNVDRNFYNCGGYALGQLGWYWPAHDEDEKDDIYTMVRESEFDEAEYLMVQCIMDEFPELVMISSTDVRQKKYSCRQYEIIAFRTARCHNNWDFHFRKLAANGRWYEKCGPDSYFSNYSYDSIFMNWIGFYDYNGPIYFFARPRK